MLLVLFLLIPAEVKDAEVCLAQGLWTLFKYATAKEWVVMVFAFLAALAAGALRPVVTVIFGVRNFFLFCALVVFLSDSSRIVFPMCNSK